MLEVGTRVRVLTHTSGVTFTETGYVGTVVRHSDYADGGREWNIIDFDPDQGPVIATEFYDNELVVLTDET
jgi:hypothetical protein